MARNIASVETKLRRRESKKLAQDSFIDDARWVELERAFQKVYSRDTGKELAALLRAGEQDFSLFCEVFLGVIPLPWQVATQEQGLDVAPYITAMLPNAGGKALRDGEPVLTPRGWVAIESLMAGDEVIAGDGTTTMVLGVYPQGETNNYRMTFNDGAEVVCSEDHVWSVRTAYERFSRDYPSRKGGMLVNDRYGTYRTMTAKALVDQWGERPKFTERVSIPRVSPVAFAHRDVPMDPYTLGALLGDGHIPNIGGSTTITSVDDEVFESVGASHGSVGSGITRVVPKASRKLTLLGLRGKRSWEKFVPTDYLWNDVETRIEVLRGLLDTDGSIDAEAGRVEFCSTSEQLADDVAFLVESLGGRATIRSRVTRYSYLGETRSGRRSYRVGIRLETMNPFRLARKAERWAPMATTTDRVLVSAIPDGRAASTCIKVAHPSGLFVTRDFIVTHNTESFELFYFHAITYRSWAAAYWGTYWAIHHGPKEAHALQVKQKIDAMLRGESRAQAYKDAGGWSQRPCLLKPFVQAAKHDKGLHEGFDFFGGAGMLTFRGTAQQAESTDGTDPMFIGMDEVRHEMYLTQIVESIFLPRALRAPGMRMYLPFTPLDASVEAVALHERGMRGHPDWRSLNMDLASANPTVSVEEKDRLMRNVNRRKVIQILGGKPIQPVGARFSREAVDSSFDGTDTPEWLGYLGDGCCDCASCIVKTEEREPLRPIYERVVSRCDICAVKGLHVSTGEKEHPMVGGIDPATSAASDSIVATVWDLWPPRRAMGVHAEVVYLEEIEPGTRIQEVTKHALAISRAIHGPCFYDAKSALGRAIEDLSYTDDGDLVAHRWNTADQKDKDLAYFRLMVDKSAWRCPFHLSTKSQMTHYVRDDKRIATDFLMAQVICAHGARYYLPDMTEMETRSHLVSADQRLLKQQDQEEPEQDGPLSAREPFMEGVLETGYDGDPFVDYADEAVS